jgi:hypothetical protein
MANSVKLSKARVAAKPPPVVRSVEIENCTNNLLHEPYSD